MIRPYKRLIGGVQAINSPEQGQDIAVSKSNKLLTPATAMTAARPPLAGKAAYMLARGRRYVTPYVFLTGVSDMEGNVARATDHFFPSWQRGVTEFGAEADPIADAIAVIEIAAGGIVGPRVSKLGKSALAGMLGQQLYKSVWALRSAREYQQATINDEFPKGQLLKIPVDQLGKEGMWEQLVGVGFAAATNDIDPGPLRNALGVAAVGHAALGSIHGEQVRRSYVQLFDDLIGHLGEQPAPNS